MNTQSITEIRECKNNIKESLRGFRTSRPDDRYGNEQEYTAQGIRAGIESILIDVAALTKAPAKFIQKSTGEERTQIATCLDKINSYIENEDLNSLAATIDEIKPILRNTGIRYTDERIDAFEEHINNLQKRASSLSQHINDFEKIKSSADELREAIADKHQKLTEELDTLKSKNESLAELIDSTETERAKLSDLLSKDSARSEEIEQLLVNSKSHSEVIENFSKKIANREAQLEDQGHATKKYEEELAVFRADHKKYLSEVEDLIESTKLALEYGTAAGLSAAFTAQYNKADNAKSKKGWLWSAGLFAIAAVGMGYWLVTGESLSLEIIIARFSLLPILIAAAWFCAGQYVKQRNIAEDYAYKAALAKSIVGFSEQLSTESNKGEEYSYFMRRVLSEMLNDPLRKHSQKASACFGFLKGDKEPKNE